MKIGDGPARVDGPLGRGGAQHILLHSYPTAFCLPVTQGRSSDPFLCKQVTPHNWSGLSVSTSWQSANSSELSCRNCERLSELKTCESPQVHQNMCNLQEQGPICRAMLSAFDIASASGHLLISHAIWRVLKMKKKGDPEWSSVQPSLLGDMNAEFKLK